jgi:hypothetical protein
VNPHGNRHVDQGSQSWTNSAISKNYLRAAVTHKDAFCIFWMKAQGDQDGPSLGGAQGDRFRKALMSTPSFEDKVELP